MGDPSMFLFGNEGFFVLARKSRSCAEAYYLYACTPHKEWAEEKQRALLKPIHDEVCSLKLINKRWRMGNPSRHIILLCTEISP